MLAFSDDVVGAMRSGLRAALVQTGKYRAGDESSLVEAADSHGAAARVGMFESFAAVVDRLLSARQ